MRGIVSYGTHYGNTRQVAEAIPDALKERGMKPLFSVLKLGVAGVKGPLVSGAVEKANEYALDFASSLG